jgi:hypothetical protein
MATKTEDPKYVRITDKGVADARRYHMFKDCSTLRGAEDIDLETISDREATLLGVSVCSVCEKRKSGGPAIDALEGFFGEDFPTYGGEPRELAWKLVDYLKERNIYLAQRGVRGEKTEEPASE